MYEELYTARIKWYNIGLKLRLELSDLDNIEDQHASKGSDRCLQKMIIMWLKKRSLNPSWNTLVDALNAKTVGEEALADSIKEKYVKPAAPEESICVAQDSDDKSKGNWDNTLTVRLL